MSSIVRVFSNFLCVSLVNYLLFLQDALLASIAETEKQSELAARVSTWKQKIEHNLEEQVSSIDFSIICLKLMLLDFYVCLSFWFELKAACICDRTHTLHLIFMIMVKKFLTNYPLKQRIEMSCPLLIL